MNTSNCHFIYEYNVTNILSVHELPGNRGEDLMTEHLVKS